MVLQVRRDGAVAKQTQQPACHPSNKTRPRNYSSAPVPSSRDPLGMSCAEGGRGIYVADLEGGVGSFSLLIFVGHRGSEQLKKSSGSNPRRRRVTNRTTPLPITRAPRSPALPSHSAFLFPRLPLRFLSRSPKSALVHLTASSEFLLGVAPWR